MNQLQKNLLTGENTTCMDYESFKKLKRQADLALKKRKHKIIAPAIKFMPVKKEVIDKVLKANDINLDCVSYISKRVRKVLLSNFDSEHFLITNKNRVFYKMKNTYVKEKDDGFSNKK